MPKPPFAPIHFATPHVAVETRGEGTLIVRSTDPLEQSETSVIAMLRRWAQERPDHTFLVERKGDGWRALTYAETAILTRGISQAFIDRGLNADTPVMLLSDNSIDNALIQLGAMQAGVPAVPVSPAYSLMSQDHAKLKHIFELVKPSVVFAVDGEKFARAFASLNLNGVEVVISGTPAPDLDSTPFESLTATPVTQAVDERFATIGLDTVAKILFTSGSTGMPKGVINTQRMLCSNQQAIKQVWPFLQERPPVVVDWLPWHHTFGGNHNFNLVLANGGTLYVDNGKPMPGLIEQTASLLREVSPTVYFNVPRGFDMLIPLLEKDEQLRDNFFKELRLIFYAAAALPQNLWERLEALSVQSRGVRVPMVSSWGSTETAPLVTSVHYAIERAGVIGVPVPGCELKMTPNNGKMELRVRGPNVTPGYFRDAAKTQEAFDEEGFYCIGDAGKFDDPNDPAKGIVFDGRVAEDFKLTTATWVSVGNLRVAALAAGAPIIQDAVVTGHDRDEVGLLIFANPAGCKSLCPDAGDLSPEELIKRPEVIQKLRTGIADYNAKNPQSSTRIARVLLMATPPNIDANEITDKGYINQRAVLDHRAELVEKLYAGGDGVIEF